MYSICEKCNSVVGVFVMFDMFDGEEWSEVASLQNLRDIEGLEDKLFLELGIDKWLLRFFANSRYFLMEGEERIFSEIKRVKASSIIQCDHDKEHLRVYPDNMIFRSANHPNVSY